MGRGRRAGRGDLLLYLSRLRAGKRLIIVCMYEYGVRVFGSGGKEARSFVVLVVERSGLAYINVHSTAAGPRCRRR
jgi:hypothetical protein